MLSSNSVEDSSSLGGKDAGVQLEGISLFVLLDVFKFLELLKTPSDDLGGGVIVELALAVSSVEATIEVGEESDTGVGAQVDFSGEGGDSDVQPVVIEGSVLLD